MNQYMFSAESVLDTVVTRKLFVNIAKDWNLYENLNSIVYIILDNSFIVFTINVQLLLTWSVFQDSLLTDMHI